MLTEMPLDTVAAHAAAFSGLHLALVLDSIIAGNTAGQLWAAAQPDEDTILLLWDKGNNVFYLSGQHVGDTAHHDLAQLIATTIRRRAIADGAPYFKVRALAPLPDSILASLFAGVALRELSTLFYEHANGRSPVVPAPTVADLQLVAIDRALLDDAALANSEQVRSEIRWMWPSEERFYAQGFGCAAVVPGQVICWCTAEYVGPTRCGVGITTVPAYERRGVATAAAARFIQEAQQRGLIPCWECGSTNIGSIRVAEKVGFAQLAEERIWVGTFAT